MTAVEQTEKKILREGRNCWRIERADKAAFLVDGASYFAAFAEAAGKAKHSIFIVGWDIDSRLRLLRGIPRKASPTLADFLNSLVSRNPDLHVRILCWDFAVIYALERELFPTFASLSRRNRRIRFRLDGRHPVGASHHQKIVVVDDNVAFVGGLDLTKRRWDIPGHWQKDPRRVDPDGKRYEPFHDVQMAVAGPAARALGELVRERWRRASRERVPGPGATGRAYAWPDSCRPDFEAVSVAIARTEPKYGRYAGVREVEALYLDSIEAARKTIYIENQYFTSHRVGRALGERLQQKDGPEIVMVLPRRCSGWLEESTMGLLRSRYLRELAGRDRYSRLKTYFPALQGGDGWIGLHSKVMVVDDRLVRVGSSNLTNRSMAVDSECDLALEAGAEEEEKTVAGFRNRLLSEHLALSPEEVFKTIKARSSLIAAVETMRKAGGSLCVLEAARNEWFDGFVDDVPSFDPDEPIDVDRLIEAFAAEANQSTWKFSLGQYAGVLVFTLLLSAAWLWTPLKDWFSLEELKAAGQSLQGNPLAPLIAVGAFVAGSLAVCPITLIIAATAFTFGTVGGIFYSFLGSLLGAGITYGIGRILGRNAAKFLSGTRINRLSRSLAKHGVLTVTGVRLLPIAPFTVVNLVAGASRIGFFDFMVGTTLGMTPGILAMTFLEKQVETAIRRPGAISFAALLALTVIFFGISAAARFGLSRRRSKTRKPKRQDFP